MYWNNNLILLVIANLRTCIIFDEFIKAVQNYHQYDLSFYFLVK